MVVIQTGGAGVGRRSRIEVGCFRVVRWTWRRDKRALLQVGRRSWIVDCKSIRGDNLGNDAKKSVAEMEN